MRCQAPDGSIGYTDKSCSVIGATAVPLSSELISRLANEAAAEHDWDAMAISDDTNTIPGYMPVAPGRRSPASGCARTPVQLAMDVHAALAMGDVNRLAESYHFAGMSSRR